MTTDSHNLGRLRFVSATDAIGREDAFFTPWLAEHIGELGDVIGVPLSLGDEDVELVTALRAQTEVPVGQYFLDIRAFADDGRVAAIENQYGCSDHKHLGQVLTYAAGVEADVVVWVAEDFTDPHLETLRWLNRRTDEQCGVWAVRIRFVQIGSSPLAPQFEVVVAPSVTARAARRSKSTGPMWTLEEFLDAISDPGERKTVEGLVAKANASGSDAMWFGKKPTGQVNLHPRNFHESPFALWIKDGSVQIYGLWNRWARFNRHVAYAPVAEALGQTLEGPVKGVALADVDSDVLWQAALLAVDELMAIRDPEVD